ncbi:MAG: DUF45 domain-containing protein [Oscillospiraceae bacterium]|nr:DUF45 domain-containing protein [Oscillospiraceae bacterium]
MDYKVIKSNRKKLTMMVERDGTVVIKAPRWTRKDRIEWFYRNNIRWIEERRREHRKNASVGVPPTSRQIAQLKKDAKAVMTACTEKYAEMMGVSFRYVKITSAKKRWGSCGKNGAICYSYRVMLLSERCREYIVVHELAHLKQFNHSKAFYAEIEKILPDYRDREKEMSQFSGYDLY